MVEMKQHNALATQEKILKLAREYGNEYSVALKERVKESQHTLEDKRLKEELQELTKKYNQEMKRLNTDISFNYNDTIKGLLVTVKEEHSEKVIREIPSKEAIELMKKMRDLVGAIFDKRG